MKRRRLCATDKAQPVKKMRGDVYETEIGISDDLFCEIIFNYVPVFEWPTLERVSKQFRRVTLSTYRMLWSVNINRMYPMVPIPFTAKEFAETKKTVRARQKLDQVLHKLTLRSPKVKELFGFNLFVEFLSQKHFAALNRMENLTNINFEKCQLDVFYLSQFLKKSPCLLHLNLSNCSFVITTKKTKSLSNAPYKLASKLFSPFYIGRYNPDLINAEIFLEEFADVKGLESLNLKGIKSFTGKFLLSIAGDNLKRLDLTDTLFHVDYVYQLLRKCYSLEYLTLNINRRSYLTLRNNGEQKESMDRSLLEEEIFHCVENLIKLRKISFINDPEFIKGEKLQEIIGRTLVKLTNLEELCFECSFCFDSRLLSCIVRSCPNLRVFQLHLPQNADSLQEIIKLDKLQSLSICLMSSFSGNLHIGDCISLLAKLDRLERATFYAPYYNNVLPSHALQNLSTVRSLKQIYISGCCVDDDLVQNLCSHLCHQLTVLEMPVCEKVTDASSSFIAMCEKLTCLNLSYSQISNLTVRNIGLSCDLLEQVDFTQNRAFERYLNVPSIVQLVNACSKIKLLKLCPALIKRLRSSKKFEKYKNFVQLASSKYEYDSFLIPRYLH